MEKTTTTICQRLRDGSGSCPRTLSSSPSLRLPLEPYGAEKKRWKGEIGRRGRGTFFPAWIAGTNRRGKIKNPSVRSLSVARRPPDNPSPYNFVTERTTQSAHGGHFYPSGKRIPVNRKIYSFVVLESVYLCCITRKNPSRPKVSLVIISFPLLARQMIIIIIMITTKLRNKPD